MQKRLPFKVKRQCRVFDFECSPIGAHSELIFLFHVYTIMFYAFLGSL